MAYYCVKCGRKLPDGAICPCRVRWGSRQENEKTVHSGVSFKNILRPYDPDYDRNTDYYERGSKLFQIWLLPAKKRFLSNNIMLLIYAPGFKGYGRKAALWLQISGCYSGPQVDLL